MEFARTMAPRLSLAPSLLDAMVVQLSTGERQRLALIRALALASPVLLLDEPTGALDEKATSQVETVLRERLADGIAIVMVTHSPEQAARLGHLVHLVEDTLTLMQHRMTAEKTGISIERRFSVRQAWAIADGDKIKQVFWNFCENAVRAMKGGGTLTVSLESLGDDWQVGFADTGTGMTPQQTEKIFEPFQSNFEGGTGLGLAIVYQIVQAHEGKVWARSKQGQGTTFVLRLRRLDAERAVSSGEAQEENGKVDAGVLAEKAAAAAGGRLHG